MRYPFALLPARHRFYDLRTIAGPTATVAAAAGLGLLAATLPMPLGAAALVGMAVFAVVLIRPAASIFVALLSVPLQERGALHVGSFAVTGTKIAVLATAAVLFLHLCTRDRRDDRSARLSAPFVMWPLLALLTVMSMSILYATSISASLVELTRWVETLVIYVAATTLIRTKREIALVLAAVLLAGIFESTLGLVQFGLQLGPPSFDVADRFSRSFGTLGMPNSYGGYIGLMLPVSLSLTVLSLIRWWERVAAWRRWRVGLDETGTTYRGGLVRATIATAVLVLTTLLLGGALVTSFSRGAWVGFAAASLAMLLAAGRRIAVPIVIATVVVATLALGTDEGIAPSAITDRLSSITTDLTTLDLSRIQITPENFATLERTAQWQIAWKMFTSHPLTGIGIGNYNVVYDQYSVAPWLISPGHAHNFYLQMAAEAGILGLLAYLAFLVGAFWEVIRSLRRCRDAVLRAVMIGILGVLTAMAVHNVFDNLHVLSLGVHTATLLAMAHVARRLSTEPPASPAIPTSPARGAA